MKLDDVYIQNIPKMNFALLLVMLMRENGKVTLTQEDMDLADDERHNICFALSLDGTALEVSVVSAQSGIIRSPEATAWAQPNQHQTFAPQGADPLSHLANQGTQYNPPPPAPELSEEEQRRLQALSIVESWQQQNLSPAAGGDGGPPQPEPGTQPNRIVEMPAKQTPEKVFPFQVGTSPQDARQVNLSEMQSQMLRKDHEIAEQEAAAAERVERLV
jgi:hypothetical protein